MNDKAAVNWNNTQDIKADLERIKEKFLQETGYQPTITFGACLSCGCFHFSEMASGLCHTCLEILEGTPAPIVVFGN